MPSSASARSGTDAPAEKTPADRRRSVSPQERVAPHDLVEVRLTVNGTPAVLSLPARVTLADALRDHLSLTGTHLGCEHGVCGMCTVLVDGDAARACLLFACQVDGAEVVTVEGLGRPDELHPLQEAFTRHHGLQCGFCTPGFLLSAYDLLEHRPSVTEDELPEELSGILCRCTGYRGILNAVAEVAREHPDGIPAPGNCNIKTLIGRGHPTSSMSPALAGDQPGATGDAAPVEQIVLPEGEPTVAVQVSDNIAATPEEVWRVVEDTHLLARCLPGAELTEDLGEDRYRGRARVALGPISLTFAGVAHIVERDADQHRLRVLGQAKDPSGGSVQADIRLSVDRVDGGSRIQAEAHVFLVGRIAQFGRSLAGDVSRSLFEQFSVALTDAAAGREPVADAKGPNALRMLTGAVRAQLLRLWRRITSKRHNTRRR
jgi:xanthine dehydrogenase YagT iron-sulfur-binding subunit